MDKVNKADKTIALTKPIVAHGETINEVILREPTAGDIAELGYPFAFDGKGGSETKADVILKYIVRLCSINLEGAKSLSAKDFNKIMTELILFFSMAD